MQELSDNYSDAPDAPEWFFNLVLKPLLEAEFFQVSNLRWCLNDEDDIFSVEGAYIVAALLANHMCSGASMSKVLDSLKKDMQKDLKTL